jgi:hypothetical protein
VHTLKGQKKSQIYYLIPHLKFLEKQEQAKLKTSRKEIIKIKAKVNETETKKKNQ